MDWWNGLAVETTLLGVDAEEPLGRAQPVHTVLPGMDGHGGVDQVRVIPVAVGDRICVPLVEGLLGEAQYPAGHRDGYTLGGGDTGADAVINVGLAQPVVEGGFFRSRRRGRS